MLSLLRSDGDLSPLSFGDSERDLRSLPVDNERSRDLSRDTDLSADFDRGDRDLDRSFERDRDRESRFGERERDFEVDLEFPRDFGDLERDLDVLGDFDFERDLDFERLRDFDRLPDLGRERLRERDLDLDTLDRLPRVPFPLPRRSSTSRIRRPFKSVLSNFSIAVFMSLYEANSTTPSFRRCLCASAYVTSPACRI